MAASPSAFSLPSTPAHPASQSTTSPTTSRHLKRLSLGATAFSPSASPTSPNTPRSSHATPTSATRSHGNRSLRLSMSGGGGLAYNRDSPASPSSAPPTTDESPTASRYINSNQSFSTPLDGTHSAPTTPNSAGVPSGSRSLGRSASGGHARRMSSISYASSSREAGDSPLGGVGLASPSPSARRLNGNGTLRVAASPTLLSRSNSPIGERGEEQSERSRSVTPNAGRREEEESSTSSVVGRGAGLGGSPNLSRGAGGGGGGGHPTLTEANADLLSFIAKKERKCLDLREELKRHESELQSLKKKWEAIVAKSLLSNSPPTTTSMPRLSSPDMKRSSHASMSSTSSHSTTSPHTSPTPRPHAPLHTLDLSLLSSTFDPTSAASHEGVGDASDIELPESVQAATKWMGGMFGKVLDAVGAVEEAMSPVYERGEEEKGLGVGVGLERLVEEEEPVEGGGNGNENGNGNDKRENWREGRRTSKTSESSTSMDSLSSFGFGFLGGGGGESSARTSTSTSTEEEDQRSTPTPSSPALPPSTSTNTNTNTNSNSNFNTSNTTLPLSPDLSARRGALTSPPPITTRPLTSQNSSHSHGRSRSTFDVLSGVTSGGWTSLGKKWTAVTESETFKNGRKTTFGLLDTFEQGLATALGPLDPPPLSPIQDEQGGFERGDSRVKGNEGRREEDGSSEKEVKTPKPGDEWDWSAFLDGEEDPSTITPSTTTSGIPKIGGYRRPSLSPNHRSSSSPTTTTNTSVPSTKSPGSTTTTKSLPTSRSNSKSQDRQLIPIVEKTISRQKEEEEEGEKGGKPALPDKEDGHVGDSWSTW